MVECSGAFDRMTGTDPLRVLVVGAGAMGMTWLRAVQAHAGLRLVGIVDADERRAKGAAIRLRRSDLAVAANLAGLATVEADVCINVTSPDAHYPVTTEALRRGLSVLSEKPFAMSLPDAVRLTRLARQQRRLLMVSQSRAYEPGLLALRDLVAGLSPISLVSTEFGVPYRVGGFRARMAQPLLLDMAVHAFDGVRRATGAAPVSVYCEAFNPPGSWYGGAAAAAAVFELSGGARYTYTGSWCAEGLATSWNGRWRITGTGGTAEWDGTGAPYVGYAAGDQDAPPPRTPVAVTGSTDAAGSVVPPLDDFVHALRTGHVPWGECADNLLTMAMVEGAIRSADTGSRVLTTELLADSGWTR